MTPFPSESLASTLHDFRAAAFGLPYRAWETLPDHTREQWRRIAARLRLPMIFGDVTGKECFDAWAHDLNATWETQPEWIQDQWELVALLLRTATQRAAA